jgi:hypothetical protein
MTNIQYGDIPNENGDCGRQPEKLSEIDIQPAEKKKWLG